MDLHGHSADVELVAKLENAFGDQFFVHIGAVSGAKVADQDAILFENQGAVMGGDGSVGEDNVTVF